MSKDKTKWLPQGLTLRQIYVLVSDDPEYSHLMDSPITVNMGGYWDNEPQIRLDLHSGELVVLCDHEELQE